MDVTSHRPLNNPSAPVVDKAGGAQGTDTVEIVEITYDGVKVKNEKVSDELFKAMTREERGQMYSPTIVSQFENRSDDVVESSGVSIKLSQLAEVEVKNISQSKEFGIG
ncbi:hypothetical protein SG34_033750 [Thalassomonas viridans]|uniref:Uncharacterized protein n=1 Tax=Thalassomonas viridans TaxID=137584 RepID=A0AAE9ZDL2_9GAMM|nr:hypothetical protein [Thalassomonas viridans]WDE08858.1 hypothetical protein SG34_033750 [Thalassomonas viridans]